VRDRYSLVVGLIFAAVIVIAVLNTLENKDEGTLGLDQQAQHWPLPEFAVPDAAGSLEGDANVAQDDCETSQAPCPGDARRVPACRIRTPGAIRVCDFFGRPFVLSFWFSRGGNTCTEQQDAVDQVYERYRGRVNFLSLDVRDDRDTVREHDGAVGALYRVGLCPTFAYVYPGGTLQSASIGELTVEQLEAHVDSLLRATRVAETG